MSKISFVSFCVEYYSDHTGKSSDEVYKLFKDSGLIDLLNEDYDDLHGMGFEYLMQFIDEFFKGGETVSYVIQGIMRKEDAIERLKFEKINSQTAFCTEKSLKDLQYIQSYEVE